VEVLVASDLQRAMQTAQALSELQAGLALQTDARLRERCYGVFEGMLYSEIAQQYPDDYARWQAREVDAVMPDGARPAEVSASSISAVWAVLPTGPGAIGPDHCHRGPWRRAGMRLPRARGMSLDSPRDFQVKNASINRFVGWCAVATGQLGRCRPSGATALDDIIWCGRTHYYMPLHAATCHCTGPASASMKNSAYYLSRASVKIEGSFPPYSYSSANRPSYPAQQRFRRSHGGCDGSSFPPAVQRAGRRLCRIGNGGFESASVGHGKSSRRTDHTGEMEPKAVQIAGADPQDLADCARFNVERGAQIIDINMGCPVKKVCNAWCGSALLQHEELVRPS
jgi:broad specificity phosphatase PhoE